MFRVDFVSFFVHLFVLFTYLFLHFGTSIVLRCSLSIASLNPYCHRQCNVNTYIDADASFAGTHYIFYRFSIQFLEILWFLSSSVYLFISLFLYLSSSFYIQLDFIWIGRILYLDISSFDFSSTVVWSVLHILNIECNNNKQTFGMKMCIYRKRKMNCLYFIWAIVFESHSLHTHMCSVYSIYVCTSNEKQTKIFVCDEIECSTLKFNIQCFKQWILCVCACVGIYLLQNQKLKIHYHSQYEYWAVCVCTRFGALCDGN